MSLSAIHPRLVYGIEECCIMTGISRRQIYKDLQVGKLRAAFVAGRRRIWHSDLELYLQGQPMPPGPAPRPVVRSIPVGRHRA
jgi:excisionase family DNA binding protein